MWCIVFTEDMHRSKNFYTWSIHRNQNLRLTTMWWAIGAGHHHHNHDFAAWVTSTRDIKLLAVNEPLITIEHCRCCNIFCVRRCNIGFCHGKCRANFTAQQWLEPFLFLCWCANTFQHFHVSCVGGRAVQALRGQRVLAEFGCNVGIVEVRQTFTSFGIG